MFAPGALGYGNWGDRPHIPYIVDDVVSRSEKEAIIQYLATHFGPDSTRKVLRRDPLVRDERALSRFLYTTYELPTGHGIHDVFPSRTTPGVVWLSGTPGAIVSVDTRVRDFASRTKDWPISDPHGQVSSHGIIEDRGHVYWTEIAGAHIGELNPRTGEMRRYPTPTPGAWQNTLRADTKGNIWFSNMSGVNSIGKLDAATKTVSEIPGGEAWNGYGLVVDDRNRIWVSVVTNPFVPMFDSRTGQWSTYPTATATRRPTIDSGGHIWAAQFFGGALSRIDAETGRVTEHPLPLTYSNPYEVVAAPDDSLWIENSRYNSVVRFDQETNTFTHVPFHQPGTHPRKMEVDADGTLWFGTRAGLTALRPNGNADD